MLFLAIRKRLDQDDLGFTLIELLIVVIIIGILAAIAIPAFLNQRERAWRAAMQSDIRNLAVEAETYFTDGQTYAGFDDEEVFTDYATTEGVQIDEASTFEAATYCIQASHLSMDETWTISPGNEIEGPAATCG